MMRKNVLIVALVLLVALVSCAEHEHAWNAGVVVKKATCVAEGEKVYTCEGCGAEMSEVLPIDYDNGHNFVDGVCTECKQEKSLITTAVARVGSAYYKTLDELFEKEKGETIDVILIKDSEISLNANTKPIGNDETKSINIHGNGNTLSFNALNNDWNNVVLKNKSAVLSISNATIKKIGYGAEGGPWNNHAICFDCNVKLNEVVANTAIVVACDSEFTDVRISDKNATQDAYMLWIVAAGQKVSLDGCTIVGNSSVEGKFNRAIAIKDQYATDTQFGKTIASVTLSVKDTVISSDKKAAILVTSTEGANIELENVNIEATPDKVNAVWIDNGSNYGAKINDKVIVKGGSAIIEGN